jgi:hypothetical protein
MKRRNKIASIAFTGSAATLTLGMTATQAMAASSWHVNYHGATTIKNIGAVTLKDHTTGATMTCGNVTGTDSVPSSHPTGRSPVLEKILTLDFNSCTIGGTIPITVKLNKAINFHGVSYSGSTGTTRGYFGTKGHASAIGFTITGTGNACRATLVNSTIPASFDNSTHTFGVDLAQTATLKVKTATSCGLLHTGDTAFAEGKLVVSPPLAFSQS